MCWCAWKSKCNSMFFNWGQPSSIRWSPCCDWIGGTPGAQMFLLNVSFILSFSVFLSSRMAIFSWSPFSCETDCSFDCYSAFVIVLCSSDKLSNRVCWILRLSAKSFGNNSWRGDFPNMRAPKQTPCRRSGADSDSQLGLGWSNVKWFYIKNTRADLKLFKLILGWFALEKY